MHGALELDRVLAELRTLRPDLEERGVRSLWVFGSVARGEAQSGSDLDLLVELGRPTSLFEFSRLKFFLEEKLGCEVDLVLRDALKDALRDSILSEAVHAA